VHGWSVGRWLVAWLAASAAPALAQDARIHVEAADNGCPDAALLEQALAPLIGDDRAVDQGAGGARAAVSDWGDRYRVEVGAVAREFDDPARDCRERARVAAVFIALNRKQEQAAPKPPAPEPPPKPQPKPDESKAEQEPEAEPLLEPAAPTAFEDRADIVHYGMQVFGAAAYAPDPSKLAPGGGAGAWLTAGDFRFELSAGALAPTDIDLQTQSGVNGAVALLRLPLSASASYLLRAGAFRFGPALGIALDVLRLHGKNLPDPQTAMRINPGGLAALDAHARLGREWLALLRLSLSAFPRAYELAVDRADKLGSTPRLWLGATLGIEYQFR
jgi:hypothetical protein